MKETELEIETVKVQANLCADFREQLEDQAAKYHDQSKSRLEEILQEVVHSS